MLPQIHFIFITQCLVQVVFCQRIQLFPYNKTNNCNISLVEENDRIMMYGKVDFNGNIPASSDVFFEIKRKTDTSFQIVRDQDTFNICFFSFLKVPEDCDKVFHYGNCFKTDDPKVFKLTLCITAFTVNSEADVRTELVYRKISFFSEIRHLPTVYGSKTVLVVVYVNDQVVYFKKTDVSLNDTQVTIVSVCRENFADNCKQQLSDLETGTLVKSGKEIIVYNTNIKDRFYFELTYSVCTIEKNISFSITTNTTTDYLHLKTGTKLILIIILSTVQTLEILFCFVVFVRTRQRCLARKKLKLIESYRKDSKQKNTDLCFRQDTCGLNDPHHFTSDQSKVQSDEVEGPLIGTSTKRKDSNPGPMFGSQVLYCSATSSPSEFYRSF